MALTDKLKAIGDAIRTKTGGTEKLTLDQMVSEIVRIESGSSSGDGGVAIATGKFKPNTSNPNITITHGLGVVPNFAVCWRSMNNTKAARPHHILAVSKIGNLGTLMALNSGLEGGQESGYSITDIPADYAPFVGAYGATDQKITFGFNYDSGRNDTYFCFETGWSSEWQWIVGVM